MSVPIRTHEAPPDPLRRARRRAHVLRALGFTAMLVALVGGLGWLGWYLIHRMPSPAPAAQRTAAGIWCIKEDCKYFDRSGAQWGEAPRSRGPLLLLVEDERTDGPVSEQFVQGIVDIVGTLPTLGVHGRFVTLPDAAPGDVHIATDQSYELIVDGYGNPADQLATLGVFLSDKAKDGSFAPQYIDLRTPGRVYFK
jgi:hypothetical protein